MRDDTTPAVETPAVETYAGGTAHGRASLVCASLRNAGHAAWTEGGLPEYFIVTNAPAALVHALIDLHDIPRSTH